MLALRRGSANAPTQRSRPTMSRSGRTQAQVAQDYLRSTGKRLETRGREWRGPCPVCGGDDRFRVAPSGYFHCRKHPGDPQHFKAMCEALGYRLDTPPSDWYEARARRAQRDLALTEEIANGPIGRKDPHRDRILAEARGKAAKAEKAAKLCRIVDAAVMGAAPKELGGEVRLVRECVRRGVLADLALGPGRARLYWTGAVWVCGSGRASPGKAVARVWNIGGKRARTKVARAALDILYAHAPELQPDADPMLCGLPGRAVVDLRRIEDRPARREDGVTRSLGCAPAGGDAERFDAFLHEMCGDDADVVRWLWRWFGYLLTGQTVVHRAVFLYGSGAAGKSTLVELLTRIMGDYAARIPPDGLVSARGTSDRHPEWMTALDGSRFASAAEIPSSGRLKAGLFKALTGADTIRANRMRADGYSFRPTAKLMLYGNAEPRLPGWDSGLRRRLVVIPCTTASQPDERLPETLWQEAPRILARMVGEANAGWQRHQAGKPWIAPSLPQGIETATADLFDSMDPLGEALNTLLAFGDAYAAVPAKRIREMLTDYFDNNGLGAVPSVRATAAELRRRGCKRAVSARTRIWRGCREA